MSFDAVITNITSVRNLKDQEKEFFKNLRLRAKLNEEYDQALTKRSISFEKIIKLCKTRGCYRNNW